MTTTKTQATAAKPVATKTPAKKAPKAAAKKAVSVWGYKGHRKGSVKEAARIAYDKGKAKGGVEGGIAALRKAMEKLKIGKTTYMTYAWDFAHDHPTLPKGRH